MKNRADPALRIDIMVEGKNRDDLLETPTWDALRLLAKQMANANHVQQVSLYSGVQLIDVYVSTEREQMAEQLTERGFKELALLAQRSSDPVIVGELAQLVAATIKASGRRK